MATERPKVVVVGGGIGGLFAANALIAHGLAVSVYEQAPALGEVGAGVFLTPNSVRHLQRVGLGPAVEKWGARVGPGSHYFRHDGAPIAPVQVTDSSGWNATFGMHRADFVDFLAKVLPAGVVHTGHRATGFAQSGTVALVSFANGATAEGDVVIAADGIHSELRPFVFPPSRPVFHGTVAYRGVVDREHVPDWPNERWLMWLGIGKHFLTFPLRAGKLINYVGFVPADQEMKESWSAPGDPDVLRREFAGWDPRIQGLLRQVQKTFRWALYDREPLPNWTKGRLSLLGDAAHPMLPHLGQGAFRLIQQSGEIDDAEMYEVFNMGVGFCVLAAERDGAAILNILRRHGRDARVIGHVIADDSKSVHLPAHRADRPGQALSPAMRDESRLPARLAVGGLQEGAGAF